jgi:hypothetical protein
MLPKISLCVVNISVITLLVINLPRINLAPNYSGFLGATHSAVYLVIYLPYYFAYTRSTLVYYYS